MIKSGIFSRFSCTFSRFKPGNLLLSTARFAGLNLEKYTGRLNLEKMPGWILHGFRAHGLSPSAYRDSLPS